MSDPWWIPRSDRPEPEYDVEVPRIPGEDVIVWMDRTVAANPHWKKRDKPRQMREPGDDDE